MRTFSGGPPTEYHGHTGWPVDEEDARQRQIKGLPAYRPADPVSIDQRPYREFAELRGPNDE